MNNKHCYSNFDWFNSVLHPLYMCAACNCLVFVAFWLSRFDPPEIPSDFDGRHKFLTPRQDVNNLSDLAPPEVPAPEDTSLRLLIEGCAAMVARCGKHIEDFYKEKSKTNTQFNFLNEGDGCSYYARKLWEYQQKYIDQQKPDTVQSKSSDKLTAENRGKILGERPLDRSTKSSSSSFPAKEAIQLQSNLADNFVKPISLVSLWIDLLHYLLFPHINFIFVIWIT